MLLRQKIAAPIALGLLLLVPAMACLEGTARTAAEQECCKQMAGQCGSAEMRNVHSCCTPSAQRGHDAVISTLSAFERVSIAAIVPSPQLPVAAPRLAAIWLRFASPPQSPLQAPAVLRI